MFAPPPDDVADGVATHGPVAACQAELGLDDNVAGADRRGAIAVVEVGQHHRPGLTSSGT